MKYLTQLIGKPVVHPDGERLGKITEAVVSPDDPLPTVSAYQIKTEDGGTFLPASAIEINFDGRENKLRVPFTKIAPYQINENDFSLVRDVLDKQIVDVHDYRVVRANDIFLQSLPDGRLGLVGVDAGIHGLMRRLGLENAMRAVAKFFKHEFSDENLIPWADVESIPHHNGGEPLKLKVPYDKLSKLHPADIADILEQMEPSDRKRMLESLDVEIAADVLAEADDDVQLSALQHLDEERAADILEEMPADEAADVLGDMDAAHRDDLLGRMDADEREDVEDLLPYHDQTAGGLMTNEYVAIKPDFTAQTAIDTLRALEPEAEMIYYIYVVDDEEKLVGVLSLRDLIIAKPDTNVQEFMIKHVRSVKVDARVEEVAHKFEKYGLLAVPVVDDEGVLHGIITIDDTLAELLPNDWRKPRRVERDREREAVA
ncbi:MAG TPA: CBS domain-containing protein [Capsulimonadaceae bacterium]|jgi:CBS domain-containing protein/sporulation protein YlmC with PRC-barrel domain